MLLGPISSGPIPPVQIHGAPPRKPDTATLERRFNNIDTNHDGNITLAELQAAKAKRNAAGHATPGLDNIIKNFSKLHPNLVTPQNGVNTLA
jgi:hypothetical protein